MTVKQLENHEKKFRKGEYMGKGWKEDFDAMCRKTVYRKLIGKWGVMSIDYQDRAIAEATAERMTEEHNLPVSDPNYTTVDTDFVDVGEIDPATGEVKEDK